MGRLKTILVGIGIIMAANILLMRFQETSKLKTMDLNLQNLRANNLKTILYWNPLFQRKDFYLGTGREIFQHCPEYRNCFATHEKEHIPLDQFDAIIFHGPEFNKDEKPQKRRAEQNYIFFNLESPMTTPKVADDHPDFYNWTMTYRYDSDVVYPHGVFLKQTTDYKPPTVEEITRRPKLIGWMVSNCDTHGRREELVRALQDHIPIDVIGPCGPLSCPKEARMTCQKLMEINYKFYLSFENSMCEDYATEKLFEMLRYDLVPIVYGAANYSKIAPPHSVIDIGNFDNLGDFVNHIYKLDADPQQYLKYFDWKKDYVVEQGRDTTLCQLCEKLNRPSKPNIYKDIGTWWRGKNNNKCLNVTRPVLL